MVQRFAEWINQVDWNEVANRFDSAVKKHIEAARTLALKGWTVPGWMGISEYMELSELSEEELDQRFTVAFTENNYQILNERIGNLISYSEMSNWKPLLLEVNASIVAGRHLIAVPALLTIMEGYSVKEVLKSPVEEMRKTDLFKLFDKAGLHNTNGLEAVPAVSNMAFLQKLFEPSSFAQKPPERINRHWILHGRDECDWSAADAFRLINALETLHWVREVQWDERRMRK